MIQVIGLVLIAMLAENMVLVRCLGMDWPKRKELTEDHAWHAGVSILLVMVVMNLVQAKDERQHRQGRGVFRSGRRGVGA